MAKKTLGVSYKTIGFHNTSTLKLERERARAPSSVRQPQQADNQVDRIRFGRAAREALPRLASKWANDNHEA